MAHNKACVLVVVIWWFVLSSGCGDPVRTTAQPVLLKVTDTISGNPTPDVEISLKYDFDHYVPQTDEWNQWERATYLWFSARTDTEGRATINVKWTMLDRTFGSIPPSWRDRVTGIAYVISLKKDQMYEEHSLIMGPGVSVRGETFTVHVLEIRPPRYVSTNGCP